MLESGIRRRTTPHRSGVVVVPVGGGRPDMKNRGFDWAAAQEASRYVSATGDNSLMSIFPASST